jgi:tetratricopeptide (TPR) repeat protein
MSLTELKTSDILKVCAKSSELIYAGQYEEARDVLGELWRGVGRYPDTDLFPPEVAAEVLLQCGSLSGCLGSAQAKDTQESTKDLLSKALHLFQSLNNPAKISEAYYELGVCYWREGAYEEARDVFYEAASEATPEQYGKIVIGRALVEIFSGLYEEAQNILTEARPRFENASHALQGRWHGHMGLALRRMARGRVAYLDKAIVEFTAAIYHYEQAGHERYCAGNLNNLAMLLYRVGRYQEAHENLYRAHRIYTCLKDFGTAVQVEETRARVLIAEEKYEEAGKVINGVIDVLERCGEKALLVDALIIKATAQARLKKTEESLKTFRQAVRIGQQSGASFNAGLAAISLIEEHRLSNKRLYHTYRLADRLLSVTQDAEALARLRECAERVAIQLGGPQVGNDFCLPDALYEIEAQFIVEALERAQGKITRAAKLLGITHQSFNSILNNRHNQLLPKRTPVKERRKSILPKQKSN